MKRTLLLIIPIALILFSLSCKKDKIETPPPPVMHTITGTILNGSTNGRFAHARVNVAVVYNRSSGFGPIATGAELGHVITDDTGGFTFTYPHQDISNFFNPRIMLTSSPLRFDSIPVNQDVDQNFYASTLGTLKVNLITDHPLKPGDTLFLAYPTFNEKSGYDVHIDTITTQVNGYYGSIRTRLFGLNLFWGRGHDEFTYDFKTGNIWSKYVIRASLGGDPIVNEVTLKY